MAKLVLIRVDFRMIHGQVATTWVTSTGATKVIVMNDDVAGDKSQKTIMQLSVGAGVKLRLWTIDRGVEEWKTDQFGKGKVIVIFREIEDAYKAYNMGFEFPKLNVGQVPMQEGKNRRHAVGTINLNDEEFDMLTDLHNKGVEVYNHQTITDAKYPYDEIKKAMGR